MGGKVVPVPSFHTAVGVVACGHSSTALTADFKERDYSDCEPKSPPEAPGAPQVLEE